MGHFRAVMSSTGIHARRPAPPARWFAGFFFGWGFYASLGAEERAARA
jgi:hypothetical protein